MTKLIHSDCLDAMRSMAENSIDSVVTDPPYELGFMGKSWDKSGVAFNPEVWQEVLRVLKPGGHLLAFSGSRTYHRMAVAIEDAGFEIRDQIMWIYGSGFPKSHNLKGDWQGWGTALKPAHEPIVVARKPLIGTVAENVTQWGTGAINIDGCRVEFVSDDDKKESTGKNQHEDFGTEPMTNNTVYGDYSMVKPTNYNPPGRWPANVIHDGSDEALELFPKTVPSTAHKRQPNGKKKTVAYGDFSAMPERISGINDQGSAARFFYCAKASKKDRNEGISNNHPTVKPTDLMRYLCRLVTPPNGTVLDPFMGSGSTGKACVLEGFEFIGIDKTAEYVEIAQARINAVLPND